MSRTAAAHLRGGAAPGATRAVLVLHGGQQDGTMATSPRQLSYLRMVDFYLALRWRSTRQTAVYLLRYRVRGWNADQPVPDPVADTRWALDQIAERHPGVPVALLGHSMGGRTAVAVSDHPKVVGVCALAPWLPAGEPLPDGRSSYAIAHGTADTVTSAPLSLEYARRLRESGAPTARFELPEGTHALMDRMLLWRRFAVGTTLGLIGDGPLPDAVARQLDHPSDQDLTTDLRTAF